jgi:dolichol-phosphate mannosyltransferase
MVAWVGYPQVCVPYRRQARAAGETKYPLRKMMRLAWTAAVSFSALPLRLSFFGAGIMTLVAIEEALRAFIEHFSGKTVPGWTSLMVVLCLSNAALMIVVGILGEYVGRVYEEGKGRPLYVVADSWNLSHPETPEALADFHHLDASGDDARDDDDKDRLSSLRARIPEV